MYKYILFSSWTWLLNIMLGVGSGMWTILWEVGQAGIFLYRMFSLECWNPLPEKNKQTQTHLEKIQQGNIETWKW